MSHQTTEVDVESLQKSGRRRGSCLDVFLVTSVLFLFVAVAALTVGGVMVVRGLRSEPLPPFPMPEFGTARLTGATPSPVYKMQNFAYLEPTSSELANATLNWMPINYGDMITLGSNYELNKDQFSLKPLREGVYFMYINLKFTCLAKCKAGHLSVRVADSLTCNVELSANKPSVSKKCWTVSRRTVREESMVITMTVPEGGLENWKLELNDSNFGIFLVD